MPDRYHILGLITARSGSEGVPGKHLKTLGQMPLLEYTFKSAILSKHLTRIALTTDCQNIITYARKFSEIHVPFVRPEELALAETPTLPVIQHAINYYEKVWQHFDYVCLLQPTTPFRAEGLIDTTISFLLLNNAESLTTVRKTPSKYHPYWSFGMDRENRLTGFATGEKIIPRRQDLPDSYYRDGQIYIASTRMVKAGLIMDNRTIAFINDAGPDINIDTMADWKQAEKWLTDGE